MRLSKTIMTQYRLWWLAMVGRYSLGIAVLAYLGKVEERRCWATVSDSRQNQKLLLDRLESVRTLDWSAIVYVWSYQCTVQHLYQRYVVERLCKLFDLAEDDAIASDLSSRGDVDKTEFYLCYSGL